MDRMEHPWFGENRERAPTRRETEAAAFHASLMARELARFERAHELAARDARARMLGVTESMGVESWASSQRRQSFDGQRRQSQRRQSQRRQSFLAAFASPAEDLAQAGARTAPAAGGAVKTLGLAKAAKAPKAVARRWSVAVDGVAAAAAAASDEEAREMEEAGLSARSRPCRPPGPVPCSALRFCLRGRGPPLARVVTPRASPRLAARRHAARRAALARRGAEACGAVAAGRYG